MRPDPDMDPICAIFYNVTWDSHKVDSKANETGVLVVDPDSPSIGIITADVKEDPNNSSKASQLTPSVKSKLAERKSFSRSLLKKTGVSSYNQQFFPDEKSMIHGLIELIQKHDPDVIIGFEVQMLSWGYLIDRSRVLDINLCPLISRIPNAEKQSRVNEDADSQSFYYGSSLEFKIAGRILLNVWRIMRSEVSSIQEFDRGTEIQ